MQPPDNPGFEQARYEDPYSGSLGNSIRYLDVTRRDNTMKVECDVDNCTAEERRQGCLSVIPKPS